MCRGSLQYEHVFQLKTSFKMGPFSNLNTHIQAFHAGVTPQELGGTSCDSVTMERSTGGKDLTWGLQGQKDTAARGCPSGSSVKSPWVWRILILVWPEHLSLWYLGLMEDWLGLGEGKG